MGNRIVLLLVELLLVVSLTLANAANNSSFSSDSFNNSNSSNRAVSYLRKESFNPHLLHRQKRWLIFELGATISLTGSSTKSLLDPVPSSLLFLFEVAVIYPLPAGIEDWFPRRKGRPKPVPPPPPPVVPPPPPPSLALPVPNPVVPVPVAQQRLIVPLSPADPVHSFYYTYPQAILGQRKSHVNQVHSGCPASKLVKDPYAILGQRKSHVNQVHSGCPASKLVKDPYGNYYCRPTAVSRRLRRELERNGANLLNQGLSPNGMLFDLLAMLSEIHQYNPRYCIMRTLCEARHLLAPPGESLFHDIFRILLRYVHPEIAHKPTYHKAFTTGHSLHELRFVLSMPRSEVVEYEPQAHHHYDRIYRRSKRHSRDCHELYPGCQFSLLAMALGKYVTAPAQFNKLNFM
ncbi:GH23842 [Drosophila grimshawi]|uniref:GH23842 n=1 Tax=Drosophila grimshawi TaxID=7222 RepID=B4K335_DROGR|nr:GH23842 [Drosophila grimshawi]